MRELVERLYAALAAGDRPALEALLHPGFALTLAEGMPGDLGGTFAGHDAIDRGWWAIGSAFRVRAEPHEFVPCADGRMLVLGTYAGTARATGREVRAAFMHLISAEGDRLTRVIQVTDTALWVAALAGPD